MTREQIRKRIESIGIIPSIRLSSHEDALFAAEAVASGGIPIVEVTMTVPGALDVIRELARMQPEIIIGAGTVLDFETARSCLDAGAQFITSPGLNVEMVEAVSKLDRAVFPGAITPSEVMAAWRSGADLVKIFPSASFGGPSYITTLKAPFPQIPLIASGGVREQTAREYILAGAVAVGVGASLVPPRAIAKREREWIRELAHRYLQLVKAAKNELHKSSSKT